jgi:hypothetical protein
MRDEIRRESYHVSLMSLHYRCHSPSKFGRPLASFLLFVKP